MDSRARPTAGIVAAGVVAILGGSVAALSILASLFVYARFQMPSTTALPANLRPLLYLTWILIFLCAVFVVVTGVQAILLRNWARIGMLVIAACMLFFGIVGLFVIFVTLFLTPTDPAVSKLMLTTVLAFIYGLPSLVSVWWLILFTRPTVTAQFSAAALALSTSPSTPSLLNNPQCPLPVRIVAWYLASFLLALPLVPFLPFSIPAYYFGHLYRGPSATLILAVNFALLAIPGVGLLLLKRWSYPLTLATQALFCLNGIFAIFSPSFSAIMRSVMDEMHLPPLPAVTQTMLNNMRYLNLLGLIIPIAIIVTLLASREAFYAAAKAPAPPRS